MNAPESRIVPAWLKRWAPVLVGGAFIVTLAIVAVRVRTRPEPVPTPVSEKPKPAAPRIVKAGEPRRAEAPPSAPERVIGEALQATATRNLIENYRLAMAQGNERSAQAALQALKRRPREARQVLTEEISHPRDASLVQFYRYALDELTQ